MKGEANVSKGLMGKAGFSRMRKIVPVKTSGLPGNPSHKRGLRVELCPSP